MNTNETLETETCTRCGGTGHHSYNQLTGTFCFKCGGSGKCYTKRGAAAHAFLRQLREVKAGSLKVGDGMYMHGAPGFSSGYWLTITEIEADPLNPGMLLISGKTKDGRGGGYGCGPETKIRKAFTGAEKDAQLRRALDFQATLTKAGKPRK